MRRPLPVSLLPRSGRTLAPGRLLRAALRAPSALSNFERLFARRFSASARAQRRFDVVSRREGFMSNIKNYEFKLVDTLKLNGKDVFKVQFRKRNKYFGHVYIEDGSFAFAKADTVAMTIINVMRISLFFIFFPKLS